MLEKENENKKQNTSPQDEVVFSWKDLKKSEQKKEPSKIRTTIKKYKLIFDFKIKKAETFLRDHWHLLIKSAAQNHLRIQECKKIQAGQACNLEFGSFTELKRYQKKVRLFTYSFSSTAFSVLIAIFVVQMFFGAGKSQGANYYWVQSAWSGVDGARVATPTNADHSKRTGWTEFSFKDTTVDVAGLDAKIATIPGSKVDTNATDFDDTNATKTNVYTVGTGDTALALRKKDGASCTTSKECGGGLCNANNVCVNPWQNGPVLAVGVASGAGTGAISAATCQTLLNAIKVYKFNYAGELHWKTTNDACNGPQCEGGVLVADNNVIFDVSPNIYPARQACKDVGGRLPNLAELACIYTNKASYVAMGGEVFYPSYGMGYGYWSATESSAASAWSVLFDSGNQSNSTMTSSSFTRCVLGQ